MRNPDANPEETGEPVAGEVRQCSLCGKYKMAEKIQRYRIGTGQINVCDRCEKHLEKDGAVQTYIRPERKVEEALKGVIERLAKIEEAITRWHR